MQFLVILVAAGIVLFIADRYFRESTPVKRANFNDVETLYRHFGMSYDGAPRRLPDDISRFRVAFLQEELDEYKAAVASGNLAGQFDALLDLVYVALGTAHLHGFPWQAGWDEVQRANMSKVRVNSTDESKRGTSFDLKKPKGWVGPDIQKVLSESV